MKQYTHIIWDWNGTLFDDAWLCVEIMNMLLQKRNKPPITHLQYLNIFDFPVKDYYRRAGFDFTDEPFEALAAEYIQAYDRRQSECRLQPYAEEVLHRCRGQGISQSILSACHQDRLDEIVQHFSIDHFFQELVGLSDYYAASKITNGQKMLDNLKLSDTEVLLVGDTTHDFDVARTLGVDCVLIPGGHHSQEKLASTGALVTDSLRELFNGTTGQPKV
jgi:phosphoglycolate phosphatase